MPKTFDCQEMPKKIRTAFFNHYDNVSNDVYVKWRVGQEEENGEKRRIVSDWLIEQGAKEGKQVLIKHWW